jgi:hypothetical protein
MIIKNEHTSFFKPKYLVWAVLFLLGLLVAYFLRSSTKSNTKSGEVFTSLEKRDGEIFKEGKLTFYNAHTQSDDRAKTGKYSSLVNPDQKYGPRYNIPTIEKGDRVCASVWRWSPISDFGYLAIQGNDGSDYLEQTNIGEEIDEEGWGKINLCVDIPDNDVLTDLKVFPYSLSKHGFAYFDDLSVSVIRADSIKNQGNPLFAKNLELYIDQKGMKAITDARDEALRYGILINNDQYSNAKLSENGQTQKVKIRLKGDWTDHLEGNRWSYRIKTAKDQAWNRMQTFSVQSPERRFFLKEWLFHDFLNQEGLLTTRYDFIWLKINDAKKQLYAFEEHFDKQLPEYKHRREGVILKFSEDAAWEQRLRSKKATGHHNTILLDAKHNSDILPFKESRIEGDSSLLKQFVSAQELLYAYKHYTRPVEEIFDIEKMAKYYAILEVLNAYHSLVWHNQRFYYDPVSKLLEPIGYDGFIEEAEYKINAHACFGYFKSNLHVNDWGKYYNALFRNEKFAAAYAHYIDKYSEKEYIKNYLTSIEEDLDQRELLLQQDFPDYDFDPKTILTKAKQINTSIPAYDNVSLKAYTDSKTGASKQVSLSNYHHLPLQIIGTGNEASNTPTISTALNQNIWSNHPDMTPEYKTLELPVEHSYVYFKILGLDKIYFSKIKKWPAGNAIVANTDTKNNIPLSETDYDSSEELLHIKSGDYTLNKPLILTDKKLSIEAGTTIDLTKGAYIECHKPITLKGTKENPILIKSSDKKGQGLLVLKAKFKSTLQHVHFDGQDNLDKGNYFMTGAITFYESPVDLTDCRFSNNSCEDALNIIRSDFMADRLHISNTYADGFDADFCKGSIKNSYATHTGNDAFDFSGSVISIENCHFTQIGDKGISAGEEATISIVSAVIDKAVIGVASKDLSQVEIDDIEVKNCNKAFAAYKKKPEYGPGTIRIKKYTESNNKFLELKENDSIIEFPEAQ